MAILRASEIRDMNQRTLDQKLEELTQELNGERGTVASGGKASNPGRIRELRRTIARILTIKKQLAGEATQKKAAPEPKKEEKENPKPEANEVMGKNA